MRKKNKSEQALPLFSRIYAHHRRMISILLEEKKFSSSTEVVRIAIEKLFKEETGRTITLEESIK